MPASREEHHENHHASERIQCQTHCENAFVDCTSRLPVGCVEALRICRESCPQTPVS